MAWYRCVGGAGGSLKLRTASGRIATFSTNMVEAFKSLKSDITPVQDLHGYSKPWSGGGGKNKAHVTATSQTINGVAYSVATDGKVTANGTASGASIIDLGSITLLGGNSYVLSGCPSSGSGSTCGLFLRGSGSFTQKVDFGSGSSFTVTDTVTTTLSLIVYNGYTASNLKFEPMVRLSDTTADFEPYSNICPISGFSALNVTRTGVNLWNEQTRNGYYKADGTFQSYSGNLATVNPIRVMPNTNYRLLVSGGTGAIGRVCWYDVNGTFISTQVPQQANIVLTSPANAYYLNFDLTGAYGTTYGNNVAVLYPSTQTTYEPYNGQTATVNFGQTVYGGVADVTNGKVNVTHALTPLNNKSWVKSGNKFYTTGFDNAPDGALYTGDFACAIGTPVNKEWNALSVGECCLRSGLYSLNKWSFVYCTDAYATVEEFVSALNADCTITYPLATPTEITTTPENLTAISGENNVYGDTNGDTEVKYLYRG